jgi:hypothetical protein
MHYLTVHNILMILHTMIHILRVHLLHILINMVHLLTVHHHLVRGVYVFVQVASKVTLLGQLAASEPAWTQELGVMKAPTLARCLSCSERVLRRLVHVRDRMMYARDRMEMITHATRSGAMSGVQQPGSGGQAASTGAEGGEVQDCGYHHQQQHQQQHHHGSVRNHISDSGSGLLNPKYAVEGTGLQLGSTTSPMYIGGVASPGTATAAGSPAGDGHASHGEICASIGLARILVMSASEFARRFPECRQ